MQRNNLKSNNAPWTTKNNVLYNILLFAVGATSTLEIWLVGRIMIAEFIAAISVVYFTFTSSYKIFNRNFAKCITILLIYFIGIAIGDTINNNYFWFSMRALARPIFILIFMLFFIHILKRDPKSFIWYIYGTIIAAILNYHKPSDLHEELVYALEHYGAIVYIWTPIIVAFFTSLIVFTYPKYRYLSILLSFACSIVLLIVGSARSIFGTWFIASTILLTVHLFKNPQRRRFTFSPLKSIGIFTIIVFSAFTVFYGYVYLAKNNHLGDEHYNKVHNQSQTIFGATPHGFILSGRVAVYAAVLGIIERPIFGFGSWRHDLTSPFMHEAIQTTSTDAQLVDRLSSARRFSGAGHSVFFQGWVENGILPAISIGLIFFISLKVLLFSIRYNNVMTAYIVIGSLTFSWTLFFSPPDQFFRFYSGLLLAFFVVYMDRFRPLSRVEVLQ